MSAFVETVRTKFDEPTARVIINGLAILCFSKTFNRAEVGFLNVENHPLFFTVYGPDCLPVAGTPAKVNSGTGIKINAAVRGMGTLYYPADKNDDDFRHLINLDELHRGFGGGRLGLKPNTYVAKLYLNNGRFYTAARSRRGGDIFPVDARDRPVKIGHRVGKVIGAELNEETVVIEISSRPEPIVLRKADGPFTVIIRYKCECGPAMETDMERFYEVLDLPPGHKKLDLVYEDLEDAHLHPCETSLLSAFEKGDEFAERMKVDEATEKLIGNLIRAREACETSTVPDFPRNLEGVQEP